MHGVDLSKVSSGISRLADVKMLRVSRTLVGSGMRLFSMPPKGARGRASSIKNMGDWLANELMDLGPTYIKIGQFISTRNDMYGDTFSECFRAMHNQVEPLRGDKARKLIAQDSGLDLSLFSHIDYDNAVAASMAQVHDARLASTGERVVIKVMRPGIRDEIAEDMVFLRNALETIKAFVDESNPIIRQLSMSIKEIGIYLEEEMDVYGEIHNLSEFGNIYPTDHPTVIVPRVLEYACTPRAIVMQYVPSTSITTLLKHKDKRGSSYKTRNELASRVMSTFILQLLNSGVLHGDPHQGNIGIHKDGRLVIYDFGCVVRISKHDIHLIKQMMVLMVIGNMEGVVKTLKDMGAEITDAEQLAGYITEYRKYIRTLDMPALIDATTQRTRLAIEQTNENGGAPPKLPVVLPPRVSRILRTFSLLEGTCKEIDPSFGYYDVASIIASSHNFFDIDFVNYKRSQDLDVVEKWFISKM